MIESWYILSYYPPYYSVEIAWKLRMNRDAKQTPDQPSIPPTPAIADEPAVRPPRLGRRLIRLGPGQDDGHGRDQGRRRGRGLGRGGCRSRGNKVVRSRVVEG